MYAREDGLVDFDKSLCIGCKACMAACPYDAIFINPEDHSAEKCNFCAHRLDMGLEPACVVVCPTQAILVGDLNDPASRVAQIVNRDPVSVRRPEKETRPKVFYRGAHQATLDPLGARRPEGGGFMWSEQTTGRGRVVSGHPGRANSSAAVLLSYDVAHTIPWDWRVSAYTWTKAIASGVYLVPVLLALLGFVAWDGPLVRWVAPGAGAAFLAATAALLVWDLEHPERFLYVITKAQPRSWLVRGGIILALYALVLGGHLLGSLAGEIAVHRALAVPGIVLAALAAVYTAYLFAQAKARDLWQSPLLPPHMIVQAVLAGAAAALVAAVALEPGAAPAVAAVLSAAATVHLGFVAGEVTLTHPTAHARLAAHEMVRGRYAVWFWTGVVAVAVAVAAVVLGPVAAVAALAGLFAHEHAYVQAGQSVPLA
jgi:formate-dependent nitrite reductase membrane component NrfD/ferredoxin